jgi:hypothetical protein
MTALNDGVFVPEPAALAMMFAGSLATLFIDSPDDCRNVRRIARCNAD